MGRIFETQEIGSLRKPGWFLATSRNPRTSNEVKESIKDTMASDNLRLLQDFGLSYVYDGEARRVEMYEHPIRHIMGFTFTDRVRSFDNRYYRKARCVSPVAYTGSYHLDEFQFLKGRAKATLKVPVTGPYTLVDWSFNEYYDSRMEFLMDMSQKVINPLLRGLAAAGAPVIQVDEPAATTHPDEMEDFREAFNAAVRDVPTRIGLHVCFSGDNYASLFSVLPEIKVDMVALEFANRDSWNLGVDGESRKGYSALGGYRERGIEATIGVGVVDVHTDQIETAELVRDRILYAVKLVGDPMLVMVNPDCGFRTRDRAVAFAKLQVMQEGVELAEKELA
jgi:5-methyltetrahydropteroyltriglutamate--homocysteine methyltransferase